MKNYSVVGLMALALTTFSSPAQASKVASADTAFGVVTFVGAIVEPVCDISTLSHQVTANCHREGETRSLVVSDFSHSYTLPKNVGTITSRTLNNTVKLTIVHYD